MYGSGIRCSAIHCFRSMWLRSCGPGSGCATGACARCYRKTLNNKENTMSIRRLNPYIILNGTAGNAIQLYQSALGAKTENMMRYGDVPGMKTIPPEQHGWVMHAMLRVGDSVLMLSDTTPDRAVTL